MLSVKSEALAALQYASIPPRVSFSPTDRPLKSPECGGGARKGLVEFAVPDSPLVSSFTAIVTRHRPEQGAVDP